MTAGMRDSWVSQDWSFVVELLYLMKLVHSACMILAAVLRILVRAVVR